MTGIVLEDLGVSQLSYFAIRSMNAAISNGKVSDGTIFYRQYAPFFTPAYFGVVGIDMLSHFTGDLITTDLDGTAMALMYGIKPTFYINDLEWMRGRYDFLTNVKLYREAARLFCRSPSHQTAIKNYCGRMAELLPIFNIEKMI